jgi:hypothetical protein
MNDSFAKEWMEGILMDFGEVVIEKQIAGEVRKIDLYFWPNPVAIDRPFMWVLTPTYSEALQRKSGGKERRAWGKGIYFLAEIDRTAVIAIHQPRFLTNLIKNRFH